MTKYQYGDVLHYKPSCYLPLYKTGYDPVQVMRFDDKRRRYLCFIFDMDGTSDCWHLGWIKEEDLEPLEMIGETPDYWKNDDGTPKIPANLDTRYFKIYVCDGLDNKLIQNDVGK
ncbi:MAG: hypothetical protein WC344_03195 [Bacilli bacterium]|jgi:hypothetical protein